MDIKNKIKNWLMPKELQKFNFDSFEVFEIYDDEMVDGKSVDYTLIDSNKKIIYFCQTMHICYVKTNKMCSYPIRMLPSNIFNKIMCKFANYFMLTLDKE